MQLIVKIINGLEHSIEVTPEISISALKTSLASQLKIPSDQQRLMFKGKSLADSSNLKDYSIGPGTKIHLIIKKSTECESTESSLTKELKSFAENYVVDAEKFVAIFNKELKNIVNELSLDEIERYNEIKLKKSDDSNNLIAKSNSTSSCCENDNCVNNNKNSGSLNTS